MNRVVLIGRITAKPELNYGRDNLAITKFTLAVDRQSKDKGADFIRVTAFGRRAESICRYMDKGRQIAVEGHIQTGSYKDKDGKTIYTTDVIIDNDEFLAEPRVDSRAETAQQIEETVNNMFGVDSFQSATDDILPF